MDHTIKAETGGNYLLDYLAKETCHTGVSERTDSLSLSLSLSLSPGLGMCPLPGVISTAPLRPLRRPPIIGGLAGKEQL